MGKENAVLVTRQQRRTLLSMLAAGGVEAYVSEMIGGSYMVEGDADKTDTSTADDTTSDSVSEEVDDMDTDFMKTCNLHGMALIESWDLG